jgi:O-antigen/teichoic acid export membrane protein
VHILLFNIINELVIILLTEKWLFTAELFKILSLGTFFIPFTGIILALLNSLGYSKNYFKTDLIIKLSFIPVYYIGLKFGIKGLAVVEFLYYTINFFVYFLVLKSLQIGFEIKKYKYILRILPIILILIIILSLINNEILGVSLGISLLIKNAIFLVFMALIMLINKRCRIVQF